MKMILLEIETKMSIIIYVTIALLDWNIEHGETDFFRVELEEIVP